MDPITVIAGAVSVLDRADVDTDQIIPKQFLKRVERTGFGEFLFYDWAQGARLGPAAEPDPRDRARTSAAARRASTRPWALQDYGFQAIVAPSFADIFFSNCTKIGLLPVVAARGRRARRSMAAGEARGRPRPLRRSRFDGGRGRRSRSTPTSAPAAQRPRRHRADAAAGRRRSPPTRRERERPGPVTTAL